MEIYHVSRSTIAVAECFTSKSKIPIEEGVKLLFLAARLMGGEFKCLADKYAQDAEIRSKTVNNAIFSGMMSTSEASESAVTQNVQRKWPA